MENMERFLKYLQNHKIVDSEEILDKWMEMIPVASKKIIEARWGLDGSPYCTNYRQLSEKLGVKNGYELYFNAEQDLADVKYIELIIDYKEFSDWRLAANAGRLAKAILVVCEPGSVYGQKLLKTLDILEEDEKRVLLLRYGLESGEIQSLQKIGESFYTFRETIRQIENKALKKLRPHTATKNFYLPSIEEEEKIKAGGYYSGKADDIGNLNLSNRVYMVLKRAGYSSIKQLKTMSPNELMKIWHLGRKGIEELFEKIENF